MTSGEDVAKGPPQTPVLTVGCRMLRSPSHESVTTDLSLFSVSSLASEAAGRSVKLVTFKPYSDTAGRGPSPNPDSKGQTHASNRPCFTNRPRYDRGAPLTYITARRPHGPRCASPPPPLVYFLHFIVYVFLLFTVLFTETKL
ncbi:hypothetical protein J6590_015615 [Homalodisca vitripennis]|nr:hypothetical protein J6590_015615 [Homalodisca vitripennis]